MSDLFGNQIVGFPTRRLNYAIKKSDIRSESRHEKTGVLTM